MNKLTIYHGSKNIIEKPSFGVGNKRNDYGLGFYCTESMELAKEWACISNDTSGYANKYILDVGKLRILDLLSEEYSILNWIAILLKNRSFDLNNPIANQAKDFLLENYFVDTNQYDIIKGYRADDSYFAFARDFVNNTISVRQLKWAMELGKLGTQVALVSSPAFAALKFVSYETANHEEYYTKKRARDLLAREEYLRERGGEVFVNSDVYIMDIIREGGKRK